MHEFKKVALAVMSMLGITAFAKDNSGKSKLTSEQKDKLTADYGEKFVAKFESQLAEMEKDGKPAEASIYNPEVIAGLEQERKDLASKIETQKSKILKLEDEKKSFEAKIAILEKDPANASGQQIADKTATRTRTHYKPDMTLEHNKVMADYLEGKVNAAYVGNTTIDTTELKKEFGQYVSSEKMEIIQKLFGATESVKEMTTVITDKTEYRAAYAGITSVLQQFTPQFTSKGVASFKPLTIKNFKQKINVPIIPSDIMTDVLGYMYDEKITSLDSMFIVKYIIEQLVKPQLDEDREAAITIGRYKEATPDTNGLYKATDKLDAMDGYLTQLVDFVNNKDTGISILQKDFAVIQTTTDEQIRLSIDAAVMEVSAKYKKKAMKVYMDPDLITRYQKGYREKYPNTKNQDGDIYKIDFTVFTLCPMEGMRGSNSYFITPKENFKHLMSQDPSNVVIRFYPTEYSTEVIAEWWEGTGFNIKEALFVHVDSAFATEHKAPEAVTSTSQGL